jgi:hypothetical protein
MLILPQFGATQGCPSGIVAAMTKAPRAEQSRCCGIEADTHWPRHDRLLTVDISLGSAIRRASGSAPHKGTNARFSSRSSIPCMEAHGPRGPGRLRDAIMPELPKPATGQTLGPGRRLQGDPPSLACIALVGKKGANNQYHDCRACVDEGLVAEANHGIRELERYEYAGKPAQQ